jgi:phosphatidylserine decarboxylase
MVEIGAFTVASIVQRYHEEQYATQGEEKGWFEPGGSTVVLLFQQGAIELNASLLEYSTLGFETRLLCGDPIGRATTKEKAS